MRARLQSRTFGALLAVQLCWVGTAAAQLPMPPSTQFDMTGFLQEATLDTPADPLSGGSLTVNGVKVTVPRNTIVILPANALTWQEVFAQAPATYAALGESGLALADFPAPLASYEVQVLGNRVLADALHPTDSYIAGLIYLSQQGLNSGSGFINFIDYALGEMRVGGVIGDPTTGARVRINDPVGRFGRVMSPDQRFTVDPDNPTIMSATGYPMCLPRTDPAVADDPLCPQGNRPRDPLGNFIASITTNNVTNPAFPVLPGVSPDSTKQAPFEIGDYIFYSGTLVVDDPTPTVGPYPQPNLTSTTYISAHTIVNNVAIYTFPGSNPAYIMTEVTILGTGGLTVVGAGEAVIRSRFEGMTTDPTRGIHLYGIDVTAAGVASDRDWGTIGVDQGPPLGAVKGRWRFRPPCLPFGSVPAKPDKDCVMNAAGTFLPPTREVRAVIEGLQGQVPGLPGALTSANGLFYGQYHAPILEYIFPENIPGSPIVENNFNTIPFLACGGYTSAAGTLASQLAPWPSNIIPDTTACAGFVAPPSTVIATASPASVISGTGALVTLSATASGTGPFTFSWAQAATDPVQVILTPVAGTSSATFVTPVVAVNTTLNFTATVTNSAGSATGSVAVGISVDQPVVNHVAPQTVLSGTAATMNITGTDPGGLPLTFTVTQTAGPAPNLAPLTVTQLPPNGARATFTLALAAGAPGVTLDFTVVATNTAGVSSAPEFTTVTVNPQADTVTITSAEYRIGKQRLIITATSNVISPAVVLTLQPYVTTTGTTFNPCATLGCLLVNNGGGLYTIDVVGAPEPAVPPARPLRVTSSLGGDSGFSALTRIRQ